MQMSEHVHLMDSDLNTVKQVLWTREKYVTLELSDTLEQLLDLLASIGRSYS